MNLNELKDIENKSRYQSFIVFEPASLRVSPSDILFSGEEVKEIYEEFMSKLLKKELTIKEKILYNRLSKLGTMLDLLQNDSNLVITKFFDRIWKRYAYISHLGEIFVDMTVYLDYFGKSLKKDTSLIALRYDPSKLLNSSDDENKNEDDDEDDDDDDGENEDEELKEESNAIVD